MRHLNIMILLCLVVVSATGCMYSTYTRKAATLALGKRGSILVLKGDEADFTKYNSIVVRKVSNPLGKEFDKVAKLLDEDLASKMTKYAVVPDVILEEPETMCPNTLILESEMLHVIEGSKIKRFVTFGGEAIILVRFKIINADTGEVLSGFNCFSILKDNIKLGGTLKDAVQPISNAVIGFFRDRIKKK